MKLMSKEEYMDIYNVVGATMKVHKILGRGLEEPVYQEALDIEFKRQNIAAQPQYPIHCYYDGIKMEKYYLADFYYRGLVIELKSVDRICAEHRSQLFNYMRLTHTYRGVLINFADRSLYSERYLYNDSTDDFILLTEQNYKVYISNDISAP